MINAIWYAVWTDIFKKTQAFIQISYLLYACIYIYNITRACIFIYILFIHIVLKPIIRAPTSRGLGL